MINYGYQIKNGVFEIVQEEAEVVRKIYALFLSGYGYMAICQELNKSSQPKDKKGHCWAVPGIQYILTNERYIETRFFFLKDFLWLEFLQYG